MPDSNAPSGDEAIRQERLRIKRYDQGIRDGGTDGALEARKEHRARLAYDDNAAAAVGKVCELCGSAITAGQDARLRPDGWWIHEACPIQ